jgi:hypothetical protein
MAEKFQQTETLLKFLSFRGVTLAKMNKSHRNVNCNCNSSLQNNKPSFNPIAAKRTKK